MRNTHYLLASVTGLLLATMASAQPLNFEKAIRYIGEFPSSTEPDFANNIQGLAQDGAHWFITQTEDIWRFPLDMDWDSVADGETNVLHKERSEYVDGAVGLPDGFSHFGDLEYHNVCGHGLLFVPLHGDDQHRSGILVVRAGDLGGKGYAQFDSASHELAGWLAVDSQGDVYMGGTQLSKIERYRLDCAQLAAGVVHFDLIAEVDLVKENGAAFDRSSKQGGCFSPTDELFILATGYESDAVADGLHVFDTTVTPWRRVEHSTNGSGLFNFAWDPSEWPEGEEPEGMTWLDLDGGGAPGMSGQLHMLLLDNDETDSDNIFLKHYAQRMYVGALLPGGNGTVNSPFQTVNQAAGIAWDGCEIRIQAGSYDETVTINKRARLVSSGGTARIGD